MLPLTGMCFASTGVDNKRIDAIQRAVKGLGGEFLSNLSEKPLNFLVVGQRWSEKYNFCATNSPGTVFIKTETLVEAQKLYIEGHFVDILQYLKQNRLAPFDGLKITASSLSIEREREIATLITGNGGEFTRTLNRDCNIVIAEHCQGKRAKFAAQWDKPIVVPSWIDICIERGLAMPLSGFLTGKTDMGPIPQRVPTPQPTPAAPEPPAKEREMTPFSVDSVPKEPELNFKLGPKHKLADYDDLFVPKAVKAVPATVRVSKSQTQDLIGKQSSGILSGFSFAMHGFDTRETGILRKTITSHDGSLDPPYDFMIVNSRNPKIPENIEKAQVITEWAIERSLFKKSMALHDVWGRPVYHHNISGFSGLKICLSGFSGVELVHLERLVILLGGDLQPSLTVDRDILVAANRDCQKFGYAKVWRIPIVNQEWLWDCAIQGEALDISGEHVLDGLGPRPIPKRLEKVLPAEPLSEQDIFKVTDHVGYGSDDDDNTHTMPVGRDFVTKTIPKRRSKRNID